METISLSWFTDALSARSGIKYGSEKNEVYSAFRKLTDEERHALRNECETAFRTKQPIGQKTFKIFLRGVGFIIEEVPHNGDETSIISGPSGRSFVRFWGDHEELSAFLRAEIEGAE
jgi:hypothetical protein